MNKEKLMKKLKFSVKICLTLTVVAFTNSAAIYPVLADEPTFAQQRDAQMALSRDRIQQIRQELDRVGTSLELYPRDYIVASRALLDNVEVSLTAFDAKILEIMSRFERPIVEYNQIIASPLSDAQKAIRLLPLDREIDRLKGQASTDYNAAIRVLFDLIPGLPHLAHGSVLHSNATAAQKAAIGCDAETRHIFKATFTNSSGQELFVGHECVKGSETAGAFPRLAPLSQQVRDQFYAQLLAPMLSRHCESEVCKQFLLLDYASVLQKVSLNIDQPTRLDFGAGSSFSIRIPLQNPGVTTWLVGANLIASSVPRECEANFERWWLRLPMGTQRADGTIAPMDYRSDESGPLPSRYTTLERYRSRADLLVSGAAHLFNFIPVIGQMIYNIHPENDDGSAGGGIFNNDRGGENSEEWRATQASKTIARCNADLDDHYGGDRDRYSCRINGWTRSGPRERMRRERYQVDLETHDPIVPVLGTTTTTEYRNRYGSGGVAVTTDVYQAFFAKQLETTRACLHHE